MVSRQRASPPFFRIADFVMGEALGPILSNLIPFFFMWPSSPLIPFRRSRLPKSYTSLFFSCVPPLKRRDPLPPSFFPFHFPLDVFLDVALPLPFFVSQKDLWRGFKHPSHVFPPFSSPSLIPYDVGCLRSLPSVTLLSTQTGCNSLLRYATSPLLPVFPFFFQLMKVALWYSPLGAFRALSEGASSSPFSL